ncbi:polyprenyl synthetase family protein [Angustibacter speluncae]
MQTQVPADESVVDAVTRRLEEVEVRLRDAVSHTDDLADSVSRHLVEAGGKRTRPTLTLLAAHLGDPTRPEVLDAAVVVELTHLATLYHDDVMDSAPTRRGAPAVHALWGNNVAILTGDLLFARASRVVAGLGPQAVRIQAATFERLCLGQMHETVGPRGDEDPVAHYLQVLADKTGSLIATSGRFGAMFSGCSREVVDVLVDYGEKVGVAFQLADDVIDLTADPEVTGKTPGTDLRERVPTLPVLLARRAAADGDTDAAKVVELLDADLDDDDALAEAVRAVREHPVTDETRRQARRWADDAVAALDALPDGEVRTALADLAGQVASRTA